MSPYGAPGLAPGKGFTRVYSASTGRTVRLEQNSTESAGKEMARFEGTGTDPQGRYNKGEIFDIEDADQALQQDLLDRGWVVRVAPADDPGRTVAQIADHVVATGGELPDGEHDRAVALNAGLDNVRDAYAKVHVGDPDVTADGELHTGAESAHGDLKRADAPEVQRTDRRQFGDAPISDQEPDAQSGVQASGDTPDGTQTGPGGTASQDPSRPVTTVPTGGAGGSSEAADSPNGKGEQDQGDNSGKEGGQAA